MLSLDIKALVHGAGYNFTPEALDNRWRMARCEVTNKKLWYIGSDDGQGFTRFSFGECADKSKMFSWCSKDKLTAIEQKEFSKYQTKIAQAKEQQQLITAEAVQSLLTDWRRDSTPEIYSQYLFDKGFGRDVPYGTVVRNDSRVKNILCVPMTDEFGFVWGVQQIFGGGAKRFWPGAKVKGTYFKFPTIWDDGELDHTFLIGEGFATCLAVWAATKHETYCAWDTGNLEYMVKALLSRGVLPRNIVLLADWDGENPAKNPGMLAVQKLTAKYKVKFAMPPRYQEHLDETWDFADLVKSGEEIVLKIQDCGELSGKLFEDPGFLPPKPKKTKNAEEKAQKFEELKQNFEESAHTSRPVEVCPSVEYSPDLGKAFAKREKKFIGSMDKGFFTFELADSGKPTTKPQYDDLALFMAQEHELKAQDAFMYIYKDGFYQKLSELELKKIITESVRGNTDPRDIGRFAQAAKTQNYIDKSCLVEPPGFINLKNGVLNLRNRSLVEHTPEYFFKYRLRHNYDPAAKAPRWLEFLDRTFEGNKDLVDVSAEIFGYSMLGGKPFLHKAFVLSGEGRNGKSTWLDVLKYLLGRSNFSSVPISNLNKPFSVVSMDGKLANIVGEITSKEIDSAAFKTAVSGEELTAAYKGMPEYDLAITARMIFACNQLPHLGDATTGAHEKFYILPFQRYIHAHERDATIAVRILFPEVEGVLNWALDGLERLIKRGKLPESEAVEAQQTELRELIDSVFAWMRVSLTFQSGVEGSILPKTLYSNYESWCSEERRTPVGPLQFSKRIVAEARKNPHLRVVYPQGSAKINGTIGLVKSLKPQGIPS